MMHEPLALLLTESIDCLLFPWRTKRRNSQHLCLPSGEKTGAVGTWESHHLTHYRADIGQTTAVGPDSLL